LLAYMASSNTEPLFGLATAWIGTAFLPTNEVQT
jgi:hypothetical protein